MLPGVNRRLLYTLASASVIIGGTLAAIQYAKGGFRVTPGGIVAQTGLLSANSFPSGAEVKIEGKLVTATDDTLYLEPGEYRIEISKEGYSPWQKQLTVQKELVTQTNAQLFRITPGLSPLTFSGVNQVSPSPDGQKIIFYTASASASLRNGIYVLELTNNPLSLQRGPRQIAEDVPDFELDQAHFLWSPDSSEVLLITPDRELLLEIDRKNDLRSLPDMTLTKRQLLSAWEEEMYKREREFLGKFPPAVVEMATQSAKNVYLSPDKKRLLYTATEAATLAPNLVPAVPAASTQLEDRNLTPGSIYVYDREEDRNFRVSGESIVDVSTKQLLATDLFNRTALTLDSSPSGFARLQASTSAQTAINFAAYHTPLFTHNLQWFPDSKHLMFVDNGRIVIQEYDGSNQTVLYSGPFRSDFMYPWPDGSKVLILTSFSPDSPANLYAVEIK